MGLLDEAIRDHLELRRRRGADPSEIARAEQEALEPVFPPESGEQGEPIEGPDVSLEEAGQAGVAFEEFPSGSPAAAAVDEGGLAPESDTIPVEGFAPQDEPWLEPGSPAPSHVSQDTAEIDMQAVLDEDAAAVDELEWETVSREPGETRMLPADDVGAVEPLQDPQIPGQERLSFE